MPPAVVLVTGVSRWLGGALAAELAADPTTLLLDDEPQVLRVGLAGDGTGATVVASDLELLPYVLSREITRLGLTRLRGRVTLLHAAALADADGRAVVLVAPSGGGKSTATSVLGQRLGYVTDESVVLRGDGVQHRLEGLQRDLLRDQPDQPARRAPVGADVVPADPDGAAGRHHQPADD